MRITIEREGCISCELCWTTCSDVFQQNPDDALSEIVPAFRVDGRNQEGQTPSQHDACAREAAEGCPTSVIHIDS